MQRIARIFASRLAVQVLGIGTAVLALAPTDALAISAGCAAINTGVFNRSVGFMNGGPTTQAQALSFRNGDILTVVWTRQSGVFEFSVNGAIQLSGGANGVNTGTYTFAATTTFTIATRMNGATGPTTVSITCAGVPDPVQPDDPDDPTDPDDPIDPNDPRPAQRALFQYNYFQFSPESLPGTAGVSQGPDIEHVFEFGGAQAASAANVPWPVAAAAYGPDDSPMQDISASGQQSMMLGGVPVNVWGRVKGTLYSGTLGRHGGQGHGVFGAAFGLTENIDVGVLGHILGGTISSDTINASMDSLIGGVGGYTMIKTESRLRFGLSTSYSWGTHTLDAVGASGRFNTTHWTVDASVARPIDVGGFVFTPMALLAYHHVNFGAYTDTAGFAVPGSRDSILQIAGVADIAYPVSVEGEFVKTVTPRFNVRVNYFALRADAVRISPLLTLEPDSVTVDLSTGVEFALQNGGNLDLVAGATGVAGSLQGYSIRGAFRVPLN